MKRAKKRRLLFGRKRLQYSLQKLVAEMPEHFEVPEDLKEWETMKPVGKELGSAETPWN